MKGEQDSQQVREQRQEKQQGKRRWQGGDAAGARVTIFTGLGTSSLQPVHGAGVVQGLHTKLVTSSGSNVVRRGPIDTDESLSAAKAAAALLRIPSSNESRTLFARHPKCIA